MYPCIFHHTGDTPCFTAVVGLPRPSGSWRKLYLEGKVLELLSLFCDEAIGKQKNTKDISREDYRCLMKAREIIDNHFLHPLTIAQIANNVF